MAPAALSVIWSEESWMVALHLCPAALLVPRHVAYVQATDGFSLPLCPPASGVHLPWLSSGPDLGAAAMSYLPVPTLGRQDLGPSAHGGAGPP